MEKGKMVRLSAICNHFKQTFSTRSSCGTEHLLRHVDSCCAKKEKHFGRIQYVLKYNPGGSLCEVGVLCISSTY